MTGLSITSIPCQNPGCSDGVIIVYNAYETGEDGLPLGHEETCDFCGGKGFQVVSVVETH